MQTKLNSKIGLRVSLMALAMSLATAPALAQVSDAKVRADQHQRAYAWLNSQVEKRFTLQLATINGFDRCVSVEQGQEGVYCFESSTVDDRWFTVSGRYDSMADAKQAAQESGLIGVVVNYIPRLLNTRCEMPSLDAAFRSHCPVVY